MRIAYAIPVSHVAPLAPGGLVAVGIETRLAVVPQFPSPVSVPLVLGLRSTHTEAQPGIDHEISLSVLGPDMAPIVDGFSTTVEFEPSDDTPAGWEVATALPVGAQFEASGEGTYSIEIKTAENSVSIPIVVRLMEPDS